MINKDLTETCRAVIDKITPVREPLRQKAQEKIDSKTKPQGSLGTIENLAIQMSMIQASLEPKANIKALYVFAGDHGIVKEGVSAYPSEVTGQMVANFLAGGAAINVLCRHHDIGIHIVDMGVDTDFENHPHLLKKKVRRGTRNFAREEAMTAEEVMIAVKNGMDVFFDDYSTRKMDIVGLGEMGIGNTTSASAIISAVTGITPEQATGRGTGLDDDGLKKKSKVIENVIDFHNPNPKNGFEILRKIGGYEIAGITGAALAAASKGVAVVLDGVISTAAGLVAYLINQDIQGYLISGHKSVEVAQEAAVSYMGLKPVIDLKMRLGEGTGAAITMSIVDSACRVMREMASFDDAGVSKKDAGENCS